MTDRSLRIGPLAGAVFCVVFYVVFFAIGNSVDVDSGAAEISAKYDDGTRLAFEVISIFILTTAFLFFAGALRSVFRESDWLSTTMSAGAAIVAVGFSLFGMVRFMLYDARDLNEAVLVTLNVIDNDNFLTVAIGISVFLLAAGARIVASRAFPKWLGWVAIVLAVLPLTGPPGFLSFVVFPLWVGALSVLMYMRRDQLMSDSTYVDLTTTAPTSAAHQPISPM